jgi:hypothetical protein
MSNAFGACLVVGNIDAAKPRPIHAHESREIGADIDDRDIIGWPILFAFTISASMILWAFSNVITTVELLIEILRTQRRVAKRRCVAYRDGRYLRHV